MKRLGVLLFLVSVVVSVRAASFEDRFAVVLIDAETEAKVGAFPLDRIHYAKALERFGVRGLVDLAALMGNYASTAAVLTVFDMQLDEGTTALLPVD